MCCVWPVPGEGDAFLAWRLVKQRESFTLCTEDDASLISLRYITDHSVWKIVPFTLVQDGAVVGLKASGEGLVVIARPPSGFNLFCAVSL
jgi:hypothetical protein